MPDRRRRRDKSHCSSDSDSWSCNCERCNDKNSKRKCKDKKQVCVVDYSSDSSDDSNRYCGSCRKDPCCCKDKRRRCRSCRKDPCCCTDSYNSCDSCYEDPCCCDDSCYDSRRRCGSCRKDPCCCDDRCGDRCNSCDDYSCNDCCSYDCYDSCDRKCRPCIMECMRTRCGYLTASLGMTASPSTVTSIGQIITYTYTLTNTGSSIIKYPVEICDNRLGSQRIRCVLLYPGQSLPFTRKAASTAADMVAPIVNSAVAYIKVCPETWVKTNTATVSVAIGGADLSGTITSTTPLSVNVTINNSNLSTLAASTVSLTFPFPVGVTSATSLTPNITVSGTNVIMTEASIAIGATSLGQFTYVAPAGAYTWSGTITSATFDPNTGNNGVSGTFIV